jgi:HNH endonuclease
MIMEARYWPTDKAMQALTQDAPTDKTPQTLEPPFDLYDQKDLPPRLAENIMRVKAPAGIDGWCWYWSGRKSRNGYGRFYIDQNEIAVHRLIYQLFVKPLPQTKQLDHKCSMKWCCNPEHLEPVTNKENARRRDERRGASVVSATARANAKSRPRKKA